MSTGPPTAAPPIRFGSIDAIHDPIKAVAFGARPTQMISGHHGPEQYRHHKPEHVMPQHPDVHGKAKLAPQHTQGAAGPDTLPRDQADALAELAGGGDGCALHVASTAPHAALHHTPAAMLDSHVADPYHLTDPEPALDAAQHADRE